MVQLTKFALMKISESLRKRFRGTFLDKIHVYVQAGNGGMGNQKFGGIGGKGGDVIMKAAEVKDLSLVKQHFIERKIKAGHGGNSNTKQLLGQQGPDVTVMVPCGVKAITDDKLIVGEINNINDEIILARGGVGGNPSTGFSGMRGQKLNLTLELSLIADVGLLGFPNAGKSTLLKACSNAKPKIADYPFTTVKPNIGILEYEDYRKISMADLPGLIEGAHANFGMGHKFLRHIERTKLVLMVVDVGGFQLSYQKPKRSAIETIMLLNKELELYNPHYLEKPMALIINKMDSLDSDSMLTEIKDKLLHVNEFSKELPAEMKSERFIQFEEIIAISAKEKVGVKLVKDYVRSAIEKLAENKLKMDERELKARLSKLGHHSNKTGPILV